ncbi:5-formyltetrahydrofolate cyclo-ligase [Flavilitoribacter nigricans]|uniref:5-formyltetrahydrofolate cyclo-ligase n=1 Tax=Flavilitoribacter nigricans (strain ATCC 23147 / DSM 23189 / NBRC 102662 / NCIMB 1420 / SS-2) TaxID=1122177 RepID=A0A2D0NDD5_FLAN2|nr:5-formyltetrahydrofolate cyclo-ligase [Flavilitoribacter nigricans]PHN06418.1 5-formyltetrahydrofolate cyclo-ligase [Flavilitoribacter nigricans DSM 23189 = NBRC 102662]
MFDKQALRLKMETLREQLNPGQKARLDALICRELQQLVEERKFTSVHTFLPMGTEVDLYPFISYLLAMEIPVFCPKTLPKRQLEHLRLHSLERLEAGLFGTRHPEASPDKLDAYDLIIVPGLAFDQHNHRLGYGGGYYDIFLGEQPGAYKVGVGYPFQLIQDLPLEAHDIPLDKVIC